MKKKAITAAKAFLGRGSKRANGRQSPSTSPPMEHQSTSSATSVPDSSEPGRHSRSETEVPSFSSESPPPEAELSTMQVDSSSSETNVNTGLL